MDLWRQDKGQTACVKEFLNAVKEKTVSPIPIEEIFEVAKNNDPTISENS